MILLFVFSCVCLHADRRPDERSANLAKFKAKEVSHVILCKKILSREFAFLFIEVTCFTFIHFDKFTALEMLRWRGSLCGKSRIDLCGLPIHDQPNLGLLRSVHALVFSLSNSRICSGAVPDLYGCGSHSD